MLAHEAAVKFYGESLVDLQGKYLLILYPEIIIRDQGGNTHLIKDLLIRIKVENNKILDLHADRLTYSDIEWANQKYMHSHVSGAPWGHFCLGDSDVKELISNSQDGSFIEDEWCLFFLTLENFLQTESNSPYRYIRSLNLASVGGSSSFNEAGHFKKFKHTFPNYKYNITINTSKEQPFQIELTNEFYFDFAKILPEEFKGIYNPRIDVAERVNLRKDLFSGDLPGEYSPNFKGAKVKTVYSTVVKEEIPYDYPLKFVCTKIENFLQQRINTTINESYRKTSEDTVRNLHQHFRGDMEFAQASSGS